MLQKITISTSRQFSLSSHEKLKGKKIIDALFKERQSVKSYPFILIYKAIDKGDVPMLFGVSVSKKFFKSAVFRNRIKRLTREAFRLNKKPLYEKLQNAEHSYALMFLYIGNELPDFQIVEQAMIKALNKFSNTIAN